LNEDSAGLLPTGELGLAVILAGGSSSNPLLYTIAPVHGAVQPAAPEVIALQTVGTARYLERSEIVRSSENYELDVMSNNWWGEPLAAMLGRVQMEELGQRLPQSTVISESGVVSASPDATIALNVGQLDEDASGNLVLRAQASVDFKGHRGPVLRSFRFVVSPPTPDIQGEVSAISTAVGQLADGLASMLVAGR